MLFGQVRQAVFSGGQNIFSGNNSIQAFHILWHHLKLHCESKNTHADCCPYLH